MPSAPGCRCRFHRCECLAVPEVKMQCGAGAGGCTPAPHLSSCLLQIEDYLAAGLTLSRGCWTCDTTLTTYGPPPTKKSCHEAPHT